MRPLSNINPVPISDCDFIKSLISPDIFGRLILVYLQFVSLLKFYLRQILEGSVRHVDDTGLTAY